MALAREDHHDAVLVRRVDHFLVADRTAGLDHAGRSGFADHVEAVAEREEGVRGGGGAGERKPGFLGLFLGDLRRVDTAHLAGTDAKRHARVGVDDRV